eukprot:Skav236736  [mRNA]  locus=scaffold3352:229625:241194:+ [translate_table: standard]
MAMKPEACAGWARRVGLLVRAGGLAQIHGSSRLFREIFQETSSGDFGIHIKDGPLFRCHTRILDSSGGFCGKVRQFGKLMSRNADHDEIPAAKEYFKAQGYTRLLDDLQSIQFSQPMERSALNGSLASKLGGKREDPLKPGMPKVSHTKPGPSLFPWPTKERYEIQCDCELMAELLRFIYCGEMSFFEGQEGTHKANEILTQKMLAICFEAERFSVDALYEKLLSWFGKRSFYVVGELNFADAFYHLQHYEHRATEEHSKNVPWQFRLPVAHDFCDKWGSDNLLIARHSSDTPAMADS